MALSTIRTALKDAIASNNKYSVYSHVPEAVIPPAVMLVTGSPWLEPIVIGNNRAFTVRYIIECVAAPMTNPSSLEKLEDMIETVLALIPTNWIILDVTSPRLRAVNATDLLAAEILIQTTYNP
jgi:hypothetical protein